MPPEFSQNVILTVRGVSCEVRAAGKRHYSVITHGTPGGAGSRRVVGEPRHVLKRRQPQGAVVDSPATPEVDGLYRAARVAGDDFVVLKLRRKFERNLCRPLRYVTLRSVFFKKKHGVGAIKKKEGDGKGAGGQGLPSSF